MTQVVRRGAPLIADPGRLGGVRAIGVDETSFLRATGRHPTLYATGVADLTAGRPARLLDVTPGRSGIVLGRWLLPTASRSGGRRSRRPRWIRSADMRPP